MSLLARLWCFLTRKTVNDGLTPLSEKARAEARMERLLAELTEVEAHWWAAQDRERREQT